MYIKKSVNPNPVEIDSYQNYILLFSEYVNQKEDNIIVRAIGTTGNYDQYLCLTETKVNEEKPIEKRFRTVVEAREAIVSMINQHHSK